MKVQQMDLKTFADADFDPKIWINKALTSSGNQEKEIFVANAVSRLQLYMKQLTNSLDETTTQIVTSLPRVVQDAALLHEEALSLQQRLLALEQKVQGVEEQTGHSIKSLQRIDKLKSKLENAASTLHEADKWAALTLSLENILEAGVPPCGERLRELAELVAAMTRSLEALSDASDYDSKRVQLETLYNRLEAAISPPLIDALTQMDAERTAAYVGLFRGMARRGAARGCWRRAAAARLAAAWRRLPAHSLPALTRLLAAHARSQAGWLAGVLRADAPLADLVALYADLLPALEPDLTKLASANLKLCADAEEGVSQLTALRRDTDALVAAVRGLAAAPQAPHELVPGGVAREFERAAFAPLRALLPRYKDLEAQLLRAPLAAAAAAAPAADQEGLVERARALLAAARRCEGWLQAARARAQRLAGAAARPYYEAAVQNFVSTLTSEISSHARRIESEFLSAVSSARATGVLSDSFAAALALEAAAGAALAALAGADAGADTESEDVPALRDAGSEPAEAAAGEGAGGEELARAQQHLATLARNILKEPVETQLEKIPALAAWSDNDALATELPDFALSPQEYITEIGQYLMTLPQHLELHVAEEQAPWQYLSEVCVHTCDVYAQQILAIRSMDALGSRRCLADIAYLSSVVEDLGSSITPALKSLEASLRAAAPPAPRAAPAHLPHALDSH